MIFYDPPFTFTYLVHGRRSVAHCDGDRLGLYTFVHNVKTMATFRNTSVTTVYLPNKNAF